MESQTVLNGHLDFIGIAELLQLLSENQATGVLRLSSSSGSNPASVFFQSGAPWHAQCGKLTGSDALYATFGWRSGQFDFCPCRVEAERSIHEGYMALILEGSKRLDDSRTSQPHLNSRADEPDSIPILRSAFNDYLYIVNEEEFNDGQPIIRQGRHGNWMWVILEGQANVVKQIDDRQETILKLGPGAFVGTLAFLSNETSRSADVIADGNVHLGVIDIQRLTSERFFMSPLFKHLLNSLAQRLRLTTRFAAQIRGGNFSQIDMPSDFKPIISSSVQYRRLFAIRNGTAAISVRTGGHRSTLFELGPQSIIGRLPFLEIDQEPDQAAVYGPESIDLVPVDAEPLRQEFDNLSSAFQSLLRNLADSIAVTTHQAIALATRSQT